MCNQLLVGCPLTNFSVVDRQDHPELLEGRASLAEGVVAVLVFKGLLKVLGFTTPPSGYYLTKAPLCPFLTAEEQFSLAVLWHGGRSRKHLLSNLFLVWEAEGQLGSGLQHYRLLTSSEGFAEGAWVPPIRLNRRLDAL